MKFKRDFYREILVAWLISVVFVYFFPNPRYFFNSLQSITTSHVMDDPVIHIGIIMKGVGRGHTKAHDLKMQFVILYRSILKHAKRKNLHFILLTDPLSVPYLEPILHKFAHKDKCNSIEVSYDFVDTSHITQNYIKPISQMRPLFTSATLQAKKYRDDLFMMGPFYHRIFPYDKLIMLDADLKFRIDVAELYDHFDRFDEKQVMGVAVDLAPHYRVAFRKFRESNPDTFVGEPGKFQGFNTGVVLYHLRNMRKSLLYNHYVSPEDGPSNTIALANRYQYSSHLGDQCLFTLLGMEHPDLFYDLPCAYNYQLDDSMNRKEYAGLFHLYHNCSQHPKIYHANGGVEIPDDDEDAKNRH